MQMLHKQPGDVTATYADINDLEREIGFKLYGPFSGE